MSELEFFQKLKKKITTKEDFTIDEDLRNLELQRKLEDIKKKITNVEQDIKFNNAYINDNKTDDQKSSENNSKNDVNEKIKWVYIAFGVFFGILFISIIVYWIYSLTSTKVIPNTNISNSHSEKLVESKFTDESFFKTATEKTPEYLKPSENDQKISINLPSIKRSESVEISSKMNNDILKQNTLPKEIPSEKDYIIPQSTNQKIYHTNKNTNIPVSYIDETSNDISDIFEEKKDANSSLRNLYPSEKMKDEYFETLESSKMIGRKLTGGKKK